MYWRSLLFALLVHCLAFGQTTFDFFMDKSIVTKSWDIFENSCDCRTECSNLNCTGYSLFRYGETLRCSFSTAWPLLLTHKFSTSSMTTKVSEEVVFFISYKSSTSGELDKQESICTNEGGSVAVIQSEEQYKAIKDQAIGTRDAWTSLTLANGSMVWNGNSGPIENTVTSAPTLDEDHHEACVRTSDGFTFLPTNCTFDNYPKFRVLCMRVYND